MRIVLQFEMAAISPGRTDQLVFISYIVGNKPWSVGFPVKVPEFAPVHTSSPKLLVSVWFTMTDPKAAKGHGEPIARLACRIQYALVEKGIRLTVRVDSPRGVWSVER